MGLRAISPGHYTTVQDRGRPGYREWGVPVGGAFDVRSLDLANALVGNGSGCAALEMTLYGGLYEAEAPLAIALAGAPMAATIVRADGQERPLVIPLCATIEAGERLRVGGTESGARTYLAVRGGWQTRERLGSRSEESRIGPGSVIPAHPGRSAVRHPGAFTWSNPTDLPIRVIAGPDAGLAPAVEEWLASTFHVSRQWDRMGLRMEGPPLAVESTDEPLSRPVAPGTIQVAGGQMLILGVACGTMGGYPHVAHVVSADLARIGQARAGDVLRFERITLREARELDRRERISQAECRRRLVTLAADGARTS